MRSQEELIRKTCFEKFDAQDSFDDENVLHLHDSNLLTILIMCSHILNS